LPALPAPAGEPAVPAPTPADDIPRRILVVEDNADAREMLKSALELAGHDVHEAADGPAGVAAALELRPEIALVDIGLPGFDGHRVARDLRRALGRSIHLVALTGYGQPDDRRQALEAGFDAHLVKPVEPRVLLGAIAAAPSSAPRDA
jgi:CheY-like chemotaxis protein